MSVRRSSRLKTSAAAVPQTLSSSSEHQQHSSSSTATTSTSSTTDSQSNDKKSFKQSDCESNSGISRTGSKSSSRCKDQTKKKIWPNRFDQTDSSEEETETESIKLSAIQKARLENNKQKALQIRRTKLAAEEQDKINRKRLKETLKTDVDSGAGFFVDDDEDLNADTKQTVEEPFVIAGDGTELPCDECCRPFALSFLRSRFDASVCDECYDREKHKLITKTNAKNKYLLKDVDMDLREPVLKCMTKKNPRNNYWGEMKLYMESQVYDRAMEIWGSMQKIEEESTKRKILSAKAQAKKYNKKLKELKMAVRSSLYKKELTAHEHDYINETYSEETDEYTSQCSTCGHSITYEKM